MKPKDKKNQVSICPPRSTLTDLQKKTVTAEYYDTTDPFIDNSELPMDEHTFFSQTKQQGFYVSGWSPVEKLC